MTRLLIKLFIRDSENTGSEAVRMRYGVLSGAVGIALNALLSLFKLIFGSAAHSIAVVADGVNNLFDAVSSIISLIGFKISGKPADKEHPFGHGRVEYVSALTLAFFILITGVELIKGSVDKFTNPEPTVFSVPAAVTLAVSIAAKLWLALFNRSIGRRIDSVAVNAVFADSIGDIAATSCSLIALIASGFTSLPVDAVMGIIVACFVIFTGIGIIRDTMGPLLGEPPGKETVDKLQKLVLSHDGIIGIHDIVLNSYGHSRVIGSLHAEVPADADLLTAHDMIDLIEREVREKLGIELSIHMDPIMVNDEETDRFRALVTETVKEIESDATIHDFRVVDGPTHTNLIFDVVLPYKSKLSEEQFRTEVEKRVRQRNGKCFCVINIDRSYVL